MICCFDCSTPLLLQIPTPPKGRKLGNLHVRNVRCTSCGAVHEMDVTLVQHSELPADMLEARRNVNR